MSGLDGHNVEKQQILTTVLKDTHQRRKFTDGKDVQRTIHYRAVLMTIQDVMLMQVNLMLIYYHGWV